MDVANMWPVAGFFTILLGGIAMLDSVVKKEHKSVILHRMLRVAQIGSRPVSLSFYILVVVCSIVLSYAIVFVNGQIQVLAGSAAEAPSLQETVAPILLGLVFKIFIWDYILALKTFSVVRVLRHPAQQRGDRPPRRLIATAPGVILVILDFVATVMLTHVVLQSWETFQSRKVEALERAEQDRRPAPTPTPSAQTPDTEGQQTIQEEPEQTEPPKSLLWRIADGLGLFDAIDFFAKDTLKTSLYILNGTPLMYLFMLVSAAARGSVKHLDLDGMTTHLFRNIAKLGALSVSIVAFAAHWVG